MSSSLFLGILLPMGCPTECAGAGCADLFPAADLTLWSGAALPTGAQTPTGGAGTLAGSAADGPDRAIVVLTGAVWVGVPGADQVRGYDLSGLTAGEPALGVLDGEAAGDAFGAALARDTSWLLVGAPDRATAAGGEEAGAVYVFAGDTLPGRIDDAEYVVTGAAAQDHLGETVSICGDLDGDGAADWVAGAPGHDAEGAALGGAAVVALSRDVGTGTVSAGDLTSLTLPGDDGARYGAAFACARSVDDDELADLFVGAPFADGEDLLGAGLVDLWLGGTGFGSQPSLRLRGLEAGDWFGSAITLAQLDDDGIPELVVGAPGHSADAEVEDDVAGAVYLYDGEQLLREIHFPSAQGLAPQRVIRGTYGRGRFGATVLAADLDGDGLDELVIGAPGHNPTGEDRHVQAGGAWLFRGPWTDWAPILLTSDATTSWVEERLYLRTGERMTTGDVDGDGVNDLILVTRSEGS